MREDRWRREAAEAIAAARRIVVLGVGNPDKGDDGAGLAAAAALRKRLSPAQKRRVRVLIGGPAPENLTGKIRALRPGLVVILDAALGGLRAGIDLPRRPGEDRRRRRHDPPDLPPLARPIYRRVDRLSGHRPRNRAKIDWG